MNRILTVILIGFIVVVASATDIRGQSALTGRWQGNTPNGFQMELNLTASEKALTGTFSRDGQAITITDGKVSKNSFTFNVTLNDQTVGFSGEMDGDRIKLWMDRQGPTAAAVLERRQ